MKKALLLLLIVAALHTAKAQDSVQRKSFVTLNLTAPVFSYAPRWNVGYVYNVSCRWWAGLTAGYGASGASFTDEDYTGNYYRLFEVRPEIYFDMRPETKLKHLASFELFYINHTDHFANNEYRGKADDMDYKYDAADYKRVKTSFNINYNLLYYITPRLVLWQKLGLGLRNRKVTYSNVVNKRESDNWLDLNLFGDSDFLEREGSYWNVNFNAELSLAYKF